ncbi:DNA polymerase III subunit beta [Rhodovarius crocodyli]|uniref:Beta sliding clamp n=1 Tax=Rhodovarius crocodyli TaxID=1979269 RepID=A0A437MF89_9PROT|nr:DNA polymerase III subunit beta [Rhodovarius crocodyli]RVT96289.1 DNA polymerase III subunit beta [Rhodovarius crocodyli]
MFDNAFKDNIVGAVSCDAQFLRAALDKAFLAVNAKLKVPALHHVLVRNDKLYATDMEMMIFVDLPPGSCSGSAFLTDPERLLAILKTADGRITVEGRRQDVKDGDAICSILVRAGDASIWSPSCPVEDFPALDRLKEAKERLTLTAEQLALAFSCVAPAISTEATRYYLNGICFDMRSEPAGFTMAATDGHRLATFDFPVEPKVAMKPIIPKLAITSLQKLLKGSRSDVLLKIGDTRAEFSSADWALTTKLIDGSFPEYGRVAATSLESKGTANWVVSADKAAFASTLARVHIQGKSAPVKLTSSGELVSGNQVDGQASAPISGALITGVPQDVGFNGKYFAEALKSAPGDRISLFFQDPGGPFLLKVPGRDDWSTTLMPLRL